MFEKTSGYKNRAFVAGVTLVFSLVIFFGSQRILDQNVTSAIQSEAIKHAAHVSQQVLSDGAQIESIIRHGRTSPDFLEHLNDLLLHGDGLIQVEIHDADGLLRYVLDETLWINQGGAREDQEMALKMARGAPLYELLNPELASKGGRFVILATEPVRDANRNVIGYIQMTIDQSGTATLFRRSFEWLIYAIPLLMVLSYLVPTIVWLFLRRRNIKTEQLVQHLQRRDGLTGLMNRATFTEVAHSIFETPAQTPFRHGLMIVDIHQFRTINDTLGHNMGDALLRNVAESINAAIRVGDIVARIGNDEFMVVLPNMRADEMARVVHRVMTRLRRPYQHGDTKIICRLCIGTHLAGPDELLDDAIQSADVALAHAKDCGPDTVTSYSTDLDERRHRRRKIEAALRNAWEDGRAFLNYQPVIDAKTRRVAGFEALLRLRTTDGELISPDEFIPIAEQTSTICGLSRVAIEHALTCAQDWPPDIFIAVNLSPAQFRNGDLVETVRWTLDQTGISPDRVEFEITESLLLDEEPEVDAQFAALKALGVSIAMDDFGTGFSSLGYLLNHDFDKLKVDRMFLEDLKANPARQQKILKSVIDLGQQLDLKLTVEGVETVDQVDMLGQLGCDLFQGYYFSPPISEEDARAMLAKEDTGAA